MLVVEDSLNVTYSEYRNRLDEITMKCKLSFGLSVNDNHELYSPTPKGLPDSSLVVALSMKRMGATFKSD